MFPTCHPPSAAPTSPCMQTRMQTHMQTRAPVCTRCSSYESLGRSCTSSLPPTLTRCTRPGKCPTLPPSMLTNTRTFMHTNRHANKHARTHTHTLTLIYAHLSLVYARGAAPTSPWAEGAPPLRTHTLCGHLAKVFHPFLAPRMLTSTRSRTHTLIYARAAPTSPWAVAAPPPRCTGRCATWPR